MDKYIKEFIDYLQYIKFINEESVSSFLNVYNTVIKSVSEKENNNSEKNLQKEKSLNSIFSNTSLSEYEIIIRTIYEYLVSLNQNQLKILSKGLIDAYNENKNKIKKKYTLRLLEIYDNKELKYYLKKWNKITFSKRKEIKNRNQLNNLNTDYSIKSSLNSNIRKKQKLFDKSNINKLISEKKKENEIIANDFISRQEKYYQKLQKSREKAFTKNEEEMQLLCSFSPKLNTNNPNIKSKYQLISNQKNERLKTSNSNNINNTNYNINNYNNNNSNRVTSPNNSKLISQRLYNEYTKIQNRKRELQKEIDNERGITFKPKSFTTNSGYNIESNFGERNKKLLEERQNFAFVYDYLRQKNIMKGKLEKKVMICYKII